MSDARITKLVDKLEQVKARAQSLKKAGEAVTGRMVHSTLVVGGGAAAGLLRGMDMTHIPGTKVQTELALGVGLTTLGLMGMGGKYSDYANSLGSGMLAVIACEQVEKAVKGYETSHKK